jgi:hypothetical protein
MTERIERTSPEGRVIGASDALVMIHMYRGTNATDSLAFRPSPTAQGVLGNPGFPELLPAVVVAAARGIALMGRIGTRLLFPATAFTAKHDDGHKNNCEEGSTGNTAWTRGEAAGARNGNSLDIELFTHFPPINGASLLAIWSLLIKPEDTRP